MTTGKSTRTAPAPAELLPQETPWSPMSPPEDRPAAVAPRMRQLMRPYSGPRDLEGQLRLAARLSSAVTAVPRQYRGEGDLLALMQHAIALDIELAVAWDNLVFNPDGVGGMRARLIGALVARAGHEIHPVHVDDRKVRMILKRGDGRPSGGAQWTLAEAQRGGLLAKTNSPWAAYGGDMLWARCLSRVVRRWAPEIMLGFYEAGEVDDVERADDGLDPVDMSTAMTDLDGNPVPAPDVMKLLTDADTASFHDIRVKYKIATEEGMLGAFAGVVDGVNMSVREVLEDLGTAAQARETEAAQTAARLTAAVNAGEIQDLSDVTDTPAAAPAAVQPPPLLSVEDAPVGTDGKLPCGCNARNVIDSGAHERGCTRAR